MVHAPAVKGIKTGHVFLCGVSCGSSLLILHMNSAETAQPDNPNPLNGDEPALENHRQPVLLSEAGFPAVIGPAKVAFFSPQREGDVGFREEREAQKSCPKQGRRNISARCCHDKERQADQGV